MALPGSVYEEARRNAANVVIVRITGVSFEPNHRLLGGPAGEAGSALVSTIVERRERGRRFKPGDALAVRLPYATPDAELPIGGAIWFDKASLAAGERARLFLDERGELVMDQFHRLTEQHERWWRAEQGAVTRLRSVLSGLFRR